MCDLLTMLWSLHVWRRWWWSNVGVATMNVPSVSEMFHRIVGWGGWQNERDAEWAYEKRSNWDIASENVPAEWKTGAGYWICQKWKMLVQNVSTCCRYHFRRGLMLKVVLENVDWTSCSIVARALPRYVQSNLARKCNKKRWLEYKNDVRMCFF